MKRALTSTIEERTDRDDLPEGWTTHRVEEVFRSFGGGTPHKGTSAFWGGTIPWLSSGDIKTDRIRSASDFITKAGLASSSAHLCRAGSVVVVVRSGILKHTLPVAVLERDAAINQDIKCFDSDDDKLNAWLALALRSSVKAILALNREGTTVQSVKYETLKDLVLPIPPLAEQDRIVTKVDDLQTRVGVTLARLTRIPELLKAFRQSVLAAACSGRLTEDWREIHSDVEPASHAFTRLRRQCALMRPGLLSDDELPGSWITATVEQLASDAPRSIQSGPFGSMLHHSEFQPSGILAIGIDNVLEGAFSNGRNHRIALAKYKDLQKYTARPLDVLITVMATVGRCCVIPEDVDTAIITKHVYRISVHEDLILPWYLMFSFRGDPIVSSQVQQEIRGQTRPGINGQILKSLLVRVPPLEEQHEIVRRVEALFKFADKIEERVAAATKRTDKLTQSILAKAFRGELVPTEADLARKEGRDYEPASVLLERIKSEREKPATPNNGIERRRAKAVKK